MHHGRYIRVSTRHTSLWSSVRKIFGRGRPYKDGWPVVLAASPEPITDEFLFRLETVSLEGSTARLFSKAAGAYVRWAPHKTPKPLFRVDVRAFNSGAFGPSAAAAAAAEETFAMKQISEADLKRARDHIEIVRAETKAQLARDFSKVQALPKRGGKQVISYGLYGGNPKYTLGAIINADLAKLWFPGW